QWLVFSGDSAGRVARDLCGTRPARAVARLVGRSADCRRAWLDHHCNDCLDLVVRRVGAVGNRLVPVGSIIWDYPGVSGSVSLILASVLHAQGRFAEASS